MFFISLPFVRVKRHIEHGQHFKKGGGKSWRSTWTIFKDLDVPMGTDAHIDQLRFPGL